MASIFDIVSDNILSILSSGLRNDISVSIVSRNVIALPQSGDRAISISEYRRLYRLS